jgi:hypothetical protein
MQAQFYFRIARVTILLCHFPEISQLRSVPIRARNLGIHRVWRGRSAQALTRPAHLFVVYRPAISTSQQLALLTKPPGSTIGL